MISSVRSTNSCRRVSGAGYRILVPSTTAITIMLSFAARQTVFLNELPHYLIMLPQTKVTPRSTSIPLYLSTLPPGDIARRQRPPVPLRQVVASERNHPAALPLR